MYANAPRTTNMGESFGFPESSSTLRNPDMAAFEAEVIAAGIEICVIPGRVGAPGVGPASNGELVSYASSKSKRFVVFPAVNPTVAGWQTDFQQWLDEDPVVVKGLVLEPGLLDQPIYPNDAYCLPVYEFCLSRNLPIILSAGGNIGPDCSYSLPIYVDQIARDFPKLNIVVAHGGWPWITAINHVAFRRGNVYVSPDMYALMPGNEGYFQAMNSYLSERYLFATSYPFVPMQPYVQKFVAAIKEEKIRERILFSNAARLLGLRIGNSTA